MTGQVMCVHASNLHIDSIAFCIPCGRILAVTSAAKSSSKAMSLFGIMQRIYMIFTASPNKTHILDATSFNSKALSDTRRECRVEGVEAIHYQTSGFRNALLKVAENSV